jgi:hypothetical protein
MIRVTPLRRITLQYSHNGLTLERTFKRRSQKEWILDQAY